MSRADVRVALLLVAALLFSTPSFAQTVAAAPVLTRAEIREFLLTAKVIRSRDTSKGVTSPKRLTLTDGTLTHDAAFQAVDERQTVANLSGGGRSAAVEMNFVDAYRYNLGAYAIAELVGLDHMMPMHVERRWNGKSR